jgi:hypothetical protein
MPLCFPCLIRRSVDWLCGQSRAGAPSVGPARWRCFRAQERGQSRGQHRHEHVERSTVRWYGWIVTDLRCASPNCGIVTFDGLHAVEKLEVEHILGASPRPLDWFRT